LYRNVIASASSTAASVAINPDTYERWFSATGTMQATFQTSSTTVDSIGIAAHNLGSKGSTIQIETLPTGAGSWTTRATITPTSDKPIFITFESATVADIRITVTGGTNREIAVIYAGVSLVMQRAMFAGHSPVDLSQVTEYRDTTSDTGNFLGRKVRRKGYATTYNWTNLVDFWYRENFQPFVESAILLPFFIQWRPDYYSEEVAYGRTTGDISPQNQGGTTRMMSVSFNFIGYA
jgi:hypothetical protein